MCWNAEVSLQTFIFSTTPLVICLYYNLIGIRDFLVYQSFISIQLLEFFLWTFLNNKTWNRNFSILGLILIISQPAFSIYASRAKYMPNVLMAYGLFAMYALTIPIHFNTTIAPTKHLSWNWLKFPVHVILIWSLFFMYSSIYLMYSGTYTDTDIKIILFLSSIYIFSFYSYYSSNTFGTMWCWIANAFSFYFYFLLLQFALKR
jgi:hypothetical protein